MSKMRRPTEESGFSLIELIVAMAVTMVISGAVYGLMAGGNNAFRREPELTDRQQNARVAMDMIQRDVATAGVNMGAFFQSFTRGLNGANALVGPAGQRADHLEIFGNDGRCPDAPTANPPTSGANINVLGGLPDCYSERAMVLVLYGNGQAKWGLAFNIHSKNSKDVNFPNGQQPTGSQISTPGTLECYAGKAPCAPPIAMTPLQVIRYEIAMDPPGSTTITGEPALYRSATGGRSTDTGAYFPPTSPANLIAGNWQVLARGIEDLQVQYRNGDPAGNWMDDPGLISCVNPCTQPTTAEYANPVREVRVTMSVRAAGQNLQGQTTSGASGLGARGTAVRGNVTTVTSVKALQGYLAEAPRTANCPDCPVWR